MFFLVFASVLLITYTWVGWRLIRPLEVGSAWRWVVVGLLAGHFISVFVSFAILRSLGPGGWAGPLYWVAYGGMGLFSLIFTGMVAMELGVLGVRLAERGQETKRVPEDPERRRFFNQTANLGVLGVTAVAGALAYGAHAGILQWWPWRCPLKICRPSWRATVSRKFPICT